MQDEITPEQAQMFLDDYKALCLYYGIEIGTDFGGCEILKNLHPTTIKDLNLRLVGGDWYLSRL